jgi:hypothetical protein
VLESPVSGSEVMENATTPTWLKESLSAVRRAPSADLQATGGLGFKRPPLETLNACTRTVASRLMSVDLSYCDANRMFDSVERAPLGAKLATIILNRTRKD